MNRAILAGAALAVAGLLAPHAAAAAQAQQAQAPQPPDRAAIDRFVEAEMQRQHIPGLSVTIMRNGSIVHQRGYGIANLEHGIGVAANTPFSIGSLSKQFIAAGITLLHQEGRIDLDAAVRTYIPDAPDSWSGITIRHLLTHTSGLVREAPGFDRNRLQPEIDVIRTAYPLPLGFQPSARFDYSNLGYFVLAEVITRASGTPWPDYFRTRIFEPLGMTATRITSLSDIIPRRADGYAWRDGRFGHAAVFPALRPSGAFVSTAQDMARWEQELARGRLLSRRSLDAMWTEARLADGEGAEYGLGWRVLTVEGRREIGHGGTLPGFRSYYARYPDEQLSIIVLTNGDGANPGDMVRAIAGMMRGVR